ncbi:MAG: thioredoxin family protein [Polyangiaceae bacterium]|nr:thioredoxin family protein [Polyangiaceae bacterium]
MNSRWWARAWVALCCVAPLGACGGGNVDRGFYGEYSEAPRGATGPNAPLREKKKAPKAALSKAGFERPKLVLIKAAWCGICKEVEPSIMAAYEPYRGKVDLIVLDVTDETTVAASHGKAGDEGLRDFFVQYGARTPTVGVFVGEGNGRLVRGDFKDPELLKRELDFSLQQKKGE